MRFSDPVDPFVDLVLASLLNFLQLKSVAERLRLSQESSQIDLRLLDNMESLLEYSAKASTIPN